MLIQTMSDGDIPASVKKKQNYILIGLGKNEWSWGDLRLFFTLDGSFHHVDYLFPQYIWIDFYPS